MKNSVVIRTYVRLTAENKQYPESTLTGFFCIFHFFFLNWIFIILGGIASHIFLSLGSVI